MACTTVPYEFKLKWVIKGSLTTKRNGKTTSFVPGYAEFPSLGVGKPTADKDVPLPTHTPKTLGTGDCMKEQNMAIKAATSDLQDAALAHVAKVVGGIKGMAHPQTPYGNIPDPNTKQFVKWPDAYYTDITITVNFSSKMDLKIESCPGGPCKVFAGYENAKDDGSSIVLTPWIETVI
jgi:hypothetical protein